MPQIFKKIPGAKARGAHPLNAHPAQSAGPQSGVLDIATYVVRSAAGTCDAEIRAQSIPPNW
jgi:hypothetical protein